MFHSETPMDDDSWVQEIVSSLPAVFNQGEDSNNQKVLRIFAKMVNSTKNEILHFSEQRILDNTSGQFLTDLAKDWGVTRIDDDDEFLRFQIRLQKFKGRMGVTDNDFKRLISMVLNIDASSFDVIPGENPEEVQVLNLPFNFTDNKQRIKRQILKDSLQQMLPLEYLLTEIQYAVNTTAQLQVGMITQHLRTTHAGLMTSRANQITHHIYVGAATQQWRRTYAELKGVEA
ncbi:hypothetical protein [Levilactobacillus brevis]|uniref:hypothetical protein n=1 Tax=Levilactobacillus brevis TaxID=1580 RepID=UPI002165D0D6|nr:hypothetical protein [Levilactobacillus brevis]MCT3565281.1 hypothetical protein [Levilactobacillus brevis]UVW18101.1 hypothetical protein NX820_09320 [Levilactobacillus brevis]